MIAFNLTNDIRKHLNNAVDERKPFLTKHTMVSVHSVARDRGLTLKDYVAQYPEDAISVAENYYDSWQQILTSAVITGSIQAEDGTEQELDGSKQRLIEKMLQSAKEDVNTVYNFWISSSKDGELRKDHLTRVLYKIATEGRNVRALEMLMEKADEQHDEADKGYIMNVYNIAHSLFDKQLDVLNSGNGTKLICCSRRAGKTHLLAATLLMECLKTTNTTCIYIGETMEQSIELLNDAMNVLVETCDLKDKKGRRLDWKHLDNGSHILVRGLSNTKDPDQILGHKAKVVVVDEFFHLKGDLLEYMVREVLRPMQMDYANEYKFICAGTPPPQKGAYGEKAWNEWECPHYTWTWKDNPYPTDPDVKLEYINKEIEELGYDWDTPYVRRNYLGEWVYDEDTLLYPEFHTYNSSDTMPSYDVDRILVGVDYGMSDNNAICAVAWDSANRRGYVFYESKFNILTCNKSISMLEQLKQEIRALWSFSLDFFPAASKEEANKRILFFADTNEQQLTQEIKINVRIDDLILNIGNAHKIDKIFMQDKIKDLFRQGHILIPEGGPTALECEMTILKRDKQGNPTREVDDRWFHPDLLPALRYALWPVIGPELTYKAPQKVAVNGMEYAVGVAAGLAGGM